MNKKEIEALDRKARELAPHLAFFRHSPRETRWIPMAEQTPEVRVHHALAGGLIFAALIGFLIYAPWVCA